MHQVFEYELQRYIPRKEIYDIYRNIIAETYYELTQSSQVSKKQILHQLKDYENRISHIRNLLATQKIDPLDYLEIKNQYSSTIDDLNKKLDTLCGSIPSIETLLEKDINRLMAFDKIFATGNIEDIRSLIQTLYPEKLIFYGTLIGKAEVNKVLKNAYNYNSKAVYSI